MPFPTDTFAAFNGTHPDGCDYCGVRGDGLSYCDWTGEALCDACTITRYHQEFECEVENDLRKEFPLAFDAHQDALARITELERLLTFANDTSELLLTQLKSAQVKGAQAEIAQVLAQAEIAQALTLALRVPS